MEKNDLPCDWTYWNNGILTCTKPAVYTLRVEGTVYHYCKEHYQESKSDFENMKDE